jgi:hypothetical protein
MAMWQVFTRILLTALFNPTFQYNDTPARKFLANQQVPIEYSARLKIAINSAVAGMWFVWPMNNSHADAMLLESHECGMRLKNRNRCGTEIASALLESSVFENC